MLSAGLLFLTPQVPSNLLHNWMIPFGTLDHLLVFLIFQSQNYH